MAFDNHGKVKWRSADEGYHGVVQSSYCHAIALYDLDGNGKPEIMAAFEVYDQAGHRLFSHDVSKWDGQYWCPANTAADLDGDGKLEVIFGNAAYHADGSLYWQIPGPPGQPGGPTSMRIPSPRSWSHARTGFASSSTTGQVEYGPVQASDPGTEPRCWSKPAVIHDFDGDGEVTSWSRAVTTSPFSARADLDPSCNGRPRPTMTAVSPRARHSTSWAAESRTRSTAMRPILGLRRQERARRILQGANGGTLIEYPVVADVDNDGSVDVVVVSNTDKFFANPTTGQMIPAPLTVPMVQVFEDAEKRWIPGRRVWNQHAYHVTNVREDGTIPAHMAKSWQRLNTFRTNAQFEGTECAPPPPNVN